MYRVKELPPGGGGKGVPPPLPRLAAFFSDNSSTHNLKYVQIMPFYAFFKHFCGSIFEIAR
jgi:hypothetical protein